MRTVLICGGRDYHLTRDDRQWLFAKLREVGATRVIHGAARGADRESAAVAQQMRLKVTPFAANWVEDGRRSAGPIRNQRMLDVGKPDFVIAFPGGTGTADMLQRARRAKACGADIEIIERVKP